MKGLSWERVRGVISQPSLAQAVKSTHMDALVKLPDF